MNLLTRVFSVTKTYSDDNDFDDMPKPRKGGVAQQNTNKLSVKKALQFIQMVVCTDYKGCMAQ